MGTDTGAILIGVGDAVSSYRDQSAITNFYLTMQLKESFGLPAILRAVTAAAKDKDHRILALQFGELPVFCRCDQKARNRGTYLLEQCQIAYELFGLNDISFMVSSWSRK